MTKVKVAINLGMRQVPIFCSHFYGSSIMEPDKMDVPGREKTKSFDL